MSLDGQKSNPGEVKIEPVVKTAAELTAAHEAAHQKIIDEAKRKRGDLSGDLKDKITFGDVLDKVLGTFDKMFTGNPEIINNFLEEIFDIAEESSNEVTSVKKADKKTEKTSIRTVAMASKSEKVKASPSAIKALEKALVTYPEWKSYAQEAESKFNIPQKGIFAIMYLESGFKPYAKNENSGAAGLGQFIPSTWKAFIEDNPEFAGKDQFDPRASFFATAWYCRQNVDHLGIDIKADDAIARIYEAHHNGEGGYRQMENFRNGKIKSFIVPKSYAKHGYDTSEKYTAHIIKLSMGVQATSDSFESALA